MTVCSAQDTSPTTPAADAACPALLTGQTRYTPVSSCSALPADSTSGYYWIRPVTDQPAVQLYCDFDRQCGCEGDSTWTRLAFLNMSDPNQSCPSDWKLASTNTSVRACTGAGLNPMSMCKPTFFSAHELTYSRVCGRVIGYQHGLPDGLRQIIDFSGTIDGPYVDGVSITHGSEGSRQHIWTFTATRSDALTRQDAYTCECINSQAWPYSTEFVESYYFCDSGNHGEVMSNTEEFFQDDPLWDGAGCGNTSTCCQFNSPPWFCRDLPGQPTSDDLEVRICHARGVEDTPVQLVELYVQ